LELLDRLQETILLEHINSLKFSIRILMLRLSFILFLFLLSLYDFYLREVCITPPCLPSGGVAYCFRVSNFNVNLFNVVSTLTINKENSTQI